MLLTGLRKGGEGGGGAEGKISFAQQSFIHKIAENQPQIVVFNLKSEFVICAYVITLCILFLESIAASSMKFVAVS